MVQKNLAVVNAYILFSICHPTVNMKQKAFRLKLADALVEEHVNARADPDCDVITRGRRVSSGQARLKGKHFATRHTVRGRCAVCGNKKKSNGVRRDTKTNNYCVKCQNYLCQEYCFETYHTKYHI